MDAVIDDRESPKPEEEEPSSHLTQRGVGPTQHTGLPSVPNQQIGLFPSMHSANMGQTHKQEREDTVQQLHQPQMQTPRSTTAGLSAPPSILGNFNFLRLTLVRKEQITHLFISYLKKKKYLEE